MDPDEETTLTSVLQDWIVDFRSSLGDHLQVAFDELDGRLGLISSPQRESNYFFKGFALPVVQLPRWLAQSVDPGHRAIDTHQLDQLSQSAVLGYLHVRVQDDLLDEGEGRPAAAMLLAEALFLRHITLLQRVCPGSERLLKLLERCWWDYGEAMLLEIELHRQGKGYDRDAFDRVLRRSHPLILPASAVLELSGRWELLEVLRRYVVHLTCGHQLFHDLTCAAKDLKLGNLTYVVQSLGGVCGFEIMHRNMLLEGGFDRIFQESSLELEAATLAAEKLGISQAVKALEQRREQMCQIRQQVFSNLFDQILAKEPTNK